MCLDGILPTCGGSRGELAKEAKSVAAKSTKSGEEKRRENIKRTSWLENTEIYSTLQSKSCTKCDYMIADSWPCTRTNY